MTNVKIRQAITRLAQYISPTKLATEEANTMKKTKKPAGRKKLHIFLLNLGKLVLDATKLSFASLVLGTIIKVANTVGEKYHRKLYYLRE